MTLIGVCRHVYKSIDTSEEQNKYKRA